MTPRSSHFGRSDEYGAQRSPAGVSYCVIGAGPLAACASDTAPRNRQPTGDRAKHGGRPPTASRRAVSGAPPDNASRRSCKSRAPRISLRGAGARLSVQPRLEARDVARDESGAAFALHLGRGARLRRPWRRDRPRPPARRRPPEPRRRRSSASACLVRRAMKSFIRSVASFVICSAWARASAMIAAAFASASAVFFSKLASRAVASSRSFAASPSSAWDGLAARVERLQDRACAPR